MGGEIEVRSTRGRGSTFAARIMILSQPSSPPVLATLSGGAARHILIVSGRAQQRTLMQETLGSLGIRSRIASIDTAAEIISGEGDSKPAFDTVIADAEEGAEGIRRLIALVRGTGRPLLRTILVVDQPGGVQLEAFRSAGCDAYLVRPVRPVSLLTQLGVWGRGEEDRARRPSDPVTEQPGDRQSGLSGERRILLIEDNDINALLARRMCERVGCTVHHAASGAAALAWCEELLASGEAIDLVLMDIHMPEMDGFETGRRVRSLYAAQEHRAPPIVAITANAFAQDRKRCLEAGFDDYLAKPFDRAELEALLGKWCAAEAAPRDGSLGDYAA
jgi:CheY-like chemotaxis protein